MNLIIVESPTKARTFNRILKGNDYYVFATMGHIRDLPEKKLSIDYKHDFKPDYVAMKNKEKVISELKKLNKNNQTIILATDPDREGESIAYHTAYLLGFIKENWPDFKIADKEKRLKRIVFHEITETALKEALENPTQLRVNLVKAQQARRTLDRIVGYELSPLLWKKIGKFWLSAGRVQTVALRLVVEREKEIRSFKKEQYMQIFGLFDQKGDSLKAKLTKKDDISYEQTFKIKLFTGEYSYTKTTINNDNVETIKKDISFDQFIINKIHESVFKRIPPPPLTTSLLQQEAFHKFGYSSKMTMRLAQDLYEAGLITYHRTDSFNLSPNFVFKTKEYVEKTWGKNYALEFPRGYKTKSKLAQEAHEAIRPTKLIKEFSELLNGNKLTSRHERIYNLIFNRAVASQMKEAEIKQMKISILGKKSYLFDTTLQKVLFDGFLKLINPEFVTKNQNLSQLKEKEPICLKNLETLESETKPPPRYNEASLIRTLEEAGIGRPSTYAPIISLIQDKGYVEKQVNYFIPSFLGEKISDYLSQAFPNIFKIDFTAKMEENLDRVAQGEEDLVELLANFYKPFSIQLEETKKDKEHINIEETTKEKCPLCANPLLIRYSKFGRFYGCSKFPDCKFTKPYVQIVEGKTCPKCAGQIVIRFTKRKKRFFGCENYPKCDFRTWRLN